MFDLIMQIFLFLFFAVVGYKMVQEEIHICLLHAANGRLEAARSKLHFIIGLVAMGVYILNICFELISESIKNV